MTIRKMLVWILCVLLLVGLTGCGAAKDNGITEEYEDYIVTEDSVSNTESSPSLPENRKLIQTVRLSAETDDLDAVLEQIDSRIAQLDGYIENSNVHNGSAYSGKRYRNATVTVRVPAKNLDAFLDKVGEVSNIVSSEKKVEDVTLNYVATESRMKALQAEEARLLELMTKANTLDELLTVEKRLTEVRTELESVTSALKVLANQVSYSTIHLNITEVKEFTAVTEPESVWARIRVGFVKSLKSVGNFFVELFVFLIVALPYLVILAVVTLVILLIVRVRKRKKSKAQAAIKDMK